MTLTEKYRSEYAGWNARHFHSWYRRAAAGASYTWVEETALQEAGVMARGPKRKGAHRKRGNVPQCRG